MIPEEIRFYFWMGRDAKSHCKGARMLQWEEFVPTKYSVTWRNSDQEMTTAMMKTSSSFYQQRHKRNYYNYETRTRDYENGTENKNELSESKV